MLCSAPDFYPAFRCLAGTCPHTCCRDWEVVLDEETVRRYEALGGEFGERLRRELKTNADGEVCFLPKDGRCPFLNEKNLCEIHLALGEEATSVTCREHPRFTEDYGAFREITLSASCPAANDLLFGSDAPLRFLSWEDDTPAEEGDEWLSWLLPFRNRVLALLEDRALPLDARMGKSLALCALAEDALARGDEAALFALPQTPADELPAADLPALTAREWTALQSLPVLDPDWRDLLEKAKTAPAEEAQAPLAERAAVYFAFRYLLKAVNDGALTSRARFCVFAVRVLRALAPLCGMGEALRRFSREIEHDAENLSAVEALANAFFTRDPRDPCAQ